MVVLSETFTLVTNLFYTLYCLPTGLPATAGQRHCAMECLTAPDCGGFVWDIALSPPCQLVVDQAVAGAALSAATAAYRPAHYRGRRIIEPPVDRYSWDSAVTACAALSAKLIDYPKTNKEKAVLLVRRFNRLFLDLNNKANPNTLTYKDKNGVVVDMSFITWRIGEPQFGDEYCLMVRGSPQVYSDTPSYNIYTAASDAGVFCIEE